MKAIKVLEKEVVLCNVPNELKALQEAVGGRIEHYYLGNGIHALVDEEGSFRNNRYINKKVRRVFNREFWNIVLLVGADGEEFTDCPEVEAWYEELCKV